MYMSRVAVDFADSLCLQSPFGIIQDFWTVPGFKGMVYRTFSVSILWNIWKKRNVLIFERMRISEPLLHRQIQMFLKDYTSLYALIPTLRFNELLLIFPSHGLPNGVSSFSL
jgi:hypothetical protein